MLFPCLPFLFSVGFTMTPQVMSFSRRSSVFMTESEESGGLEHMKSVAPDEVTDARWVLLFNEGTSKEGVYMVKEEDNASILTFSYYGDAYKYAVYLAESVFQMAAPKRWTAVEIVSFCKENEFRVVMFPKGAVPYSPLHNSIDLSLHDYFRQRLEKVYELRPEDCHGDDCLP